MDGEVRIKAYAMDVECRRLSFGGMEADLLENSGLNGCGNKDERVWFKRRRFAYEGFDGLGDEVALHIGIEFLQQVTGVLGPEAT